MLFWLNDSRTIDPDAGPRSTHLALAISISILCCWFVVPSHCLGDETNATVVKDFLCPWVDTVPQSTTFACWLDEDRFQFRFTVEDNDVVLQENWDGENTLEREDRVAFAISNDQEFGQLYCLELDAKGRVRDFKKTYSKELTLHGIATVWSPRVNRRNKDSLSRHRSPSPHYRRFPSNLSMRKR
jgi:hypothetical protein